MGVRGRGGRKTVALTAGERLVADMNARTLNDTGMVRTEGCMAGCKADMNARTLNNACIGRTEGSRAGMNARTPDEGV